MGFKIGAIAGLERGAKIVAISNCELFTPRFSKGGPDLLVGQGQQNDTSQFKD